MSNHLLEIGPGSSPLVDPSLARSDWQGYIDGGTYTAVQPATHRAVYEFPKVCLTLPRVNLIESPIEDARISDGSYDEVFAANVLGDPGIDKVLILEQATRVVRAGGLITFLDTNTPEERPSLEKITAFLSDSCRLVKHLEPESRMTHLVA